MDWRSERGPQPALGMVLTTLRLFFDKADAMLDENEAIWIPNNNYFPGRSGHKPRWIIIHGTAGFTSAEEVAHFFKSTEGGDNPVSSHYIIGLDGASVQCIREKDSAWANGGVTVGHDRWWSRALNPNLVTVSIEHLKLSRDNSDEISTAQKEASFRLIKHICQRHAILPQLANEHGGITGHYSMDPVHRWFCPGPYPWDELIAYLNR
jgi:N-acetyl-anhydromuramyl-L-alanine amidase AmpD